jgi:Holliday junction resolvase RusA-like endonuclease
MNQPWTMRFNGQLPGKGRPRFDRRTGRAYTPTQTRVAEADLAYGLRQSWHGPPLEGAVVVTAVISVAMPASWSAKRKAAALGEPAVCKPDIDNVIKLIADAGNGLVWADDKQIVTLSVHRSYADAPGLLLTVAPVVSPSLRASSMMSCETVVETEA